MNKLKERLLRLQGNKATKQKEVADLQAKIASQRKSLHNHEKAKEIIREVGLLTQEQLKFHLEDITTLAMESIFDNPYKLKVDFIKRREKSECDLMFERNGNVVKPLDASGGGTVDIAAFALRVASWSMMNPRTDNVLLLDEPTKNVSEDLREKVSEMLKQVSEKLNIQMIIVTHDTSLTANADRIFKVTKKGKTSKVTTI